MSRRVIELGAALAVIMLTMSLGLWQLRRADFKQSAADALASADAQAPLRVGGLRVDATAVDQRRVEVSGRWLPERSVFLDNRTHAGRAGFHVFTPLIAEPDESSSSAAALHVLVLRGWVARDLGDRTRLPEVRTEPGVVRVTGTALAHLPAAMQLGATAREGQGGRIWQAVDVERFARWSNLSMQPVIVRQTSETDDGLVRQWPNPGRDVDKHRGYATQWFAMAVAALVWSVWAWRRGRSA